ncbi:MAG: alpha/beta hydrolase [Alphaproteobacteria bacterium]|nr:alpha/beta hydrolase [Alphaproteobacteria bacterium SS10]
MEYLWLIAISYVVLLGFLALAQRSLMYFPDQDLPAPPSDFTATSYQSHDGLTIPAWYRAPQNDAMPVILFFHGNAGNLSYFVDKVRPNTADGAGLYMAEYRGYGGAPGSPTERDLVVDGLSALEALEAKGISPDRVVLHGLSLGSGVAVQVAAQRAKDGKPVAAVILEAPYSSTLEIAQWRFPVFPVGLVMRDTFKSTVFIADIGAPLLILHGTRDGIIPQRFGRKLFDAAVEPKTFISLEGENHIMDGRGRLGLEFRKFLIQFNQANAPVNPPQIQEAVTD